MSDKIWGFFYGSISCMDIKCLELNELSDTWSSPRTYKTKKEALEALSAHLKRLLDSED
jgi:hypothetical protein